MTLDLDALERDARDAASHGEVELYRSITPQSVLALIECVQELERMVEDAKEAAFERDMGDDL